MVGDLQPRVITIPNSVIVLPNAKGGDNYTFMLYICFTLTNADMFHEEEVIFRTAKIAGIFHCEEE